MTQRGEAELAAGEAQLFVDQVRTLRESLHRAVVGQDETIDLLLICALTGSHALVVGVPRLTKTLMVKDLAAAFRWKFARSQFTPDLMPADITGYELLDGRSAAASRCRVRSGRILRLRDHVLAVAAEQMSMFNDDGTPKPGEPLFMFFSPISSAERDKLLADAFKTAKERAGRLAKAAGAELGALRALGDNEVDASDEMLANGPYGGNPSAYRMMQMMRSGRGASHPDETSEAIGAQPNKVVYRVMVNASFELKAK